MSEQQNQTSRLRSALLVAGFLVLLAALGALIVGGAAREAVTRPLLYVAWFVGVLFGDFPQAAIWAVFVTIGLILAISSLSGGERSTVRRPAREAQPQGRVAQLAHWLAEASEARYFERLVSRRLLNLTLQAKDIHEPQSVQEAERLLQDGALGLPPDLRDYLANRTHLAYLGDLDSMTRPSRALLVNLRAFFLPRPPSNGSTPVEIEPELERLIATLEDELEIPHEYRH